MKPNDLIKNIHSITTSKKGVSFIEKNKKNIEYYIYDNLFMNLKYFRKHFYLYFCIDEKNFIDPAKITTISDNHKFNKKLQILPETSEKLLIFFVQHSYNYISSKIKTIKNFKFDPIKEYIKIIEDILEDHLIEKSEEEYINNYLKAVDISENKAKKIYLRTLAEKIVKLFNQSFNFLKFNYNKTENSFDFFSENTTKKFMKLLILKNDIELLVFLTEKDIVKILKFSSEPKKTKKNNWYLFYIKDFKDLKKLIPIVHTALNRAVHNFYI